jgi:putative GTP pyrophosphokinase
MNKTINDYVQKFEEIHPRLKSMEFTIEHLLRELFNKDPKLKDPPPPYEGKPNIYHIESRVKDVKSFSEKLKRPGKSYNDPINDITDLLGFRVIAYYTGDVDIISRVIDKEFIVDRSHSGDTASRLQPDQFGYLSRHFVVSMTKDRVKKLEYCHCNNFKFEIQVRTILQHAWATLSHKLTYKAEQEAPKQLRRQIANLSATLELADNESSRLQGARQKIQRKYKSKISEKNYESLPIDVDSIVIYLEESKHDDKWAKEASNIEAPERGWIIEKLDKGNPEHVERERLSRSSLVRILQFAKIQTIQELDNLLKNNVPEAKEYLKKVFNELKLQNLSLYATPHDILRGLIIFHKSDIIRSQDLSYLGYDKPLVDVYTNISQLKNCKKNGDICPYPANCV